MFEPPGGGGPASGVAGWVLLTTGVFTAGADVRASVEVRIGVMDRAGVEVGIKGAEREVWVVFWEVSVRKDV